MTTESKNDRPKVVVLGGGFGGMFAAKTLAKNGKARIDVELINAVNYFVFQPLLPEVAAGSISTSDAASPLREIMPGVTVRKADIANIDLKQKSVTIVQGTKRRLIPVPYDHLVLAIGQKVDLTRIPGMTEHALTIKDLSDAVTLRNHVIDCLEHADVTRYPKLKKKLLTFVVVGAGFSGVETIGEMKELIDRSLRYYPNVDASEIKVILLEFAPRILGELPESLATYATEQLEKRDISVMCGVGTKSASGTSLELTNGDFIETKTIVATIGNGPSPLVEKLGLDLQVGKVVVDRTLQVPGHSTVWSIGDAALIPMKDNPSDRYDYAPPTAQFAVREGAHVAKNILGVLDGKAPEPFNYTSKGSMASLGGKRAVAEVNGVRLSGFMAWLLWRTFYLSFLPGWRARVRVMINWAMDLVLARSIVQVHYRAPSSTKYQHVRAGKRVFDEGMQADGFYVVMEGRFKLIISDPDGGEDTVREYGPGDHFGERVIFGEGTRTGLVVCLEDGLLLVVARDDFQRFANGFPVLRDYFSDYIPQAFPKTLTAAPKEREDIDGD